ncbi:Activating signal cointegrator 1 complex subunit 2 [Ilyonectria robusta]
MPNLPPLAPFPKAAWRQHLSSSEWDSLLAAWIALCHAWLALSDTDLKAAVSKDESVAAFLASFAEETAEAGTASLGSHSTLLMIAVFQLTSRILTASPPPQPQPQLLAFPFLADLAKIYPRRVTAPLISQLFSQHSTILGSSLTSLKKLLIPHLDSGIKGDLNLVESQLTRLNHLLHVSPDACTLALAGSDFFDGLVTCFRVMNPPLRKVIVTTTYLCLVGLVDAEPPKWAMLNDELYALKSAADAHKTGPLNVNDSLVPELVTSTPLLKLLQRRAEDSGAATENLKNRITALESFKKGAMVRPKRLVRRKIDKGKGKNKETQHDLEAEIHVHRMSQITQVQDLFPDLGAGFVAKCLDEYGDDVEQVVANLLSETLPPHLANADRTELLYASNFLKIFPRVTSLTPFRSLHAGPRRHTDLAPRPTPPHIPTRHNVFDDDELDRLALDTSKLSFGKNPTQTADDILKDKSTAPNKAAILSALAAFDSDDDERDDTYDAADVGGTVDAANNEADGVNDGNEEVLFRAFQMDAKVFDRDATTRRGGPRTKLREETGMTDETIEGWAVMLTRNPQQKRRLEAKRNKESNKGSRANHNRRDARAKKMARGGFPG